MRKNKKQPGQPYMRMAYGLNFKELGAVGKKYEKYFKEQVLPVLSPQIVDANAIRSSSA